MCHNIIFVVVYSLIACRSFVRPIATSGPALPHSRHLLGANSAFIFSYCLCLCLRCGRSWSLFFFRFAWGSAVANDLSFVLIAADVAVTAIVCLYLLQIHKHIHNIYTYVLGSLDFVF